MRGIPAVRAVIAGAVLLAAASLAQAQGVIKLGLIGEFSGPFAQYGQQIYGGMKTYMKLNGDTVAGKKIEVIQKDTGGPAPDVAKRLAQELVTRDKVDFLVGFGLTPNALAVAPVATEAKVPMIVMNAATSIITTKSPYIARLSITQPIAIWAAKNGIKKVYTVVADYGPGIDAEGAFIKAFKEGGGEIVGSVRTPLQNPEYAPFIQRVKDAKPDAIFLFLPAGEQGIARMGNGSLAGGRHVGFRTVLYFRAFGGGESGRCSPGRAPPRGFSPRGTPTAVARATCSSRRSCAGAARPRRRGRGFRCAP